MQSFRSPRARRRLLMHFALLVLAASVYLPNLHHAFQYDDETKLVHNTKLVDPLAYFRSFGQPGYSEDTTRLLANLSFCLSLRLTRWNLLGHNAADPWDPFWFNVTNLAIHLVVVWLTARFGRAVLRRLGQKNSPVPWLAAAMFAVHPLNSEAVNYCNARPNTMVAAFYLLSLLNLLRLAGGATSAWVRARRWAAWYLSMAAALFAKEFAITLAGMGPLLLWWLGQGGADGCRRFLWRRWYVHAANLVLGVTVVLLTGAHSEVSRIVADVGPKLAGSSAKYMIVNALGQSQVMAAYLGLALLPLPRLLNFDHDIPRTNELVWPPEGMAATGPAAVLAWPVVCAAAIAGLAVFALVRRRAAPLPTFFLLWPFIVHSPTSFVPRGEEMVEYRTYLPMVGVCLFLAWGVERVLAAVAARLPVRRPAALRWAAGAALVAALAWGTLVRNPVWATPVSFWSDVVSKSRGRFRVWVDYGKALEEAERADESPEARARRQAAAIDAYYRALGIEPGLWQAYNNLGYIELKQGRLADARRDLHLSLEFGSTSPLTYRNLAGVYFKMTDFDRMMETLQTGVVKLAWTSLAYQYLADGQATLGRREAAQASAELCDLVQLIEFGRIADAVRGLEAFAAAHPDNIEACYVLGLLYYNRVGNRQRGEAWLLRTSGLRVRHPAARQALRLLSDVYGGTDRPADAARMLEDLVQRDPTDVDAHLKLSALYGGPLGDTASAAAHLRSVIELVPESPAALAARRGLAIDCAKLGRPEEAARLLEEVLVRAPQDYEAHVGLGFLYVQRLNDRARGIPHLRRAVELNPTAPDSQTALRLLNGLPPAPPR